MQTSKVLSTAAHIRRLQYQWSQDRCLQKRIPLSRSWRGCLGLAILLDNPDDTYSHGDMALVRNEQLTWLALRDVPGSHPVNRAFGLNIRSSYASATKARLCQGMPFLDFTTDARDSINFRRLPLCKKCTVPSPRNCRMNSTVGDVMDAGDTCRFAALNRLSQAMTHFAFFGTDVSGAPWQPFWAKSHPGEGKPYVTPKPATWMPQPFLGLESKDVDRVCHAVVTSAIEASPSMALYDGFSRSLAGGMIFGAMRPEVYCSEVSSGPDGRIHHLRSTIDQTSRFVSVPAGAKVLVKRGETLEAAQPWIRVLPDVLHRRSPDIDYAGLPAGWVKLRCLCGNAARFRRMLTLWFEQQFIRVESQPSLVLIPASLLASVAQLMRPDDLWWDTQPMLAHYDWETQVTVLPPVPLRQCDGLRI